ncbi:MAG: hypothetical protein ACXAC2_01130 [Candidatus Kariarchaeaceae archaeon]
MKIPSLDEKQLRLLKKSKIKYPMHFKNDLVSAYGSSHKLYRAINGKSILLGEFIGENFNQSWRSGEFLKRWMDHIRLFVPGFTELEELI